jgi:hypothetical protein
MYPALLQKNSAVARAPEQIVAQQRFDLAQNPWLCHRMQAMAPVVAPHTIEQETAGVPANSVALFKNADLSI